MGRSSRLPMWYTSWWLASVCTLLCLCSAEAQQRDELMDELDHIMSPQSNPNHHKASKVQDVLLGSSNAKPGKDKDELSEQLDEIMNADSKEVQQQTVSSAHERKAQPQDGPDL